MPVQPLIVLKKKRKKAKVVVCSDVAHICEVISFAASVARMYLIANMDLVWTHLFMFLHYSCFLSNDKCSATKHTVGCQLRSSSVLHCLSFFLSCQIRPHWPVKARKGSASCSEVVSVKDFKKDKRLRYALQNCSSKCLFVRERTP